MPFSAITAADVRRSGEPDRETLRRRAAHAGPIDGGTLLYRVEFHLLRALRRAACLASVPHRLLPLCRTAR